MNIRNQMDLALDEALKESLEGLFKEYLKDGNEEALKKGLRRLETAYALGNKMLDTL